MSMAANIAPTAASDRAQSYLTLTIADQLLGLPLACVQDVFGLDAITPVPLSGAEIAGVVNLRGRILTVIDMRARLGLPPAEEGGRGTAVGIHWAGESYGLRVDRVGGVLRLASRTLRRDPPRLDPLWAAVCEGVHPLDGALLVVLSVPKLLSRRDPHAIRVPADTRTSEPHRSPI